MLLDDYRGDLIYIPTETREPRSPIKCRVEERCSDRNLKYPTYVICIEDGVEDAALGQRFAVTIPYALSGIIYPEEIVSVHTYKSISDVLEEPKVSPRVIEFGRFEKFKAP